MKIVTAANADHKEFLDNCVASVRALGYECVVYDFGGLGTGVDWPIDPATFQKRFGKTRMATGLPKPGVVQDAMRTLNDQIVWVDADTVLRQKMDLSGDYDVGVALRPKYESDRMGMSGASGMFGLEKFLGKYNSGFVVFNPTDAARKFIDEWVTMTEKNGNDQFTLCSMIQEGLKSGSIALRKFPRTYNDPEDRPETVLYHLKSNKKINQKT